jgi:hypothetical protein
MRPVERFFSKVSGVTYQNPDGVSRQEIIDQLCFSDQPLLLMREPNNPYSENAIGVWVAYQIGYVKPELADQLALILDEGGVVEARVTEVTGGTEDKPTLGVNIELTIYE